MTEKTDRLAALLANAELLRDFNTATDILPSSQLDAAIKEAREQDPPDYYSEQTARLREEVRRIVSVIKPTALAEIRRFYPYTTTRRPARTLFGWVFPTIFAIFSLLLLFACAKYTLWSKDATQFMNEVQAEQSRLASERFNEVLASWDVVPVLLEYMGKEPPPAAATNPAEDFRTFNEYHQKYTAFVQRQRELENAIHPSRTIAAGWNAVWNRVRPLFGIEPEMPAPDAAPTGEASTGGPRDLGLPRTIAPSAALLPGGPASAPGPGVAAYGGVGKVPPAGALPAPPVGAPPPPSDAPPSLADAIPKGQGYFLDVEAGCLPKLVKLIEDSQKEVPEFIAAGGSGDSAQARLVDERLAAAWTAIKSRDINMQAFACFFNVRPGDLVTANNMRDYYLGTVRVVRNRLDIMNSWVLPGIYGMLGAVMLTLRAFVNPRTPSPTASRTVIRVLLGGFVGVVIGWFWSPQSSEFFEFANISLGLFTMAFLFGYGNDIFFGILERLVGAVAGAIENAGSNQST